MREKKEWLNPELIVLVRSKPEEAILTACKDNGLQGAGNYYSGCFAVGTGCSWCSADAPS